MARLTDTRTTPPGGWRYVQPETGCEMMALTMPDLVTNVAQHRAFKGLAGKDAETIIVDIERQLCSGLEPRFCRAEPGETYAPLVDMPSSLTVSKVTAGSLAFFTFLKSGGEMVTPEESERRAAICRGCRYNRNADGCGACSALYAMISAIVPPSRTSPGLKACSRCGCLNKAKVLMPAAVILAAEKANPTTYPAHCWINPILNHG